MKQSIYDQLCVWDSAVDNNDKPTLGQILSLYTGMHNDPSSIITYIKIHHAEWEKIAQRSSLSSFDELVDILIDALIYRDPQIDFQILRYCGDGTLTTLIEINNCRILNKSRDNKYHPIYKTSNVYIELDWNVGSLAE